MTTRAPSLFIGHGSPMNAIEENTYTQTLNALGARFEKPKAILVISAHWLSAGTWITAMKAPRTIHDFYGFPKELFEVQYPAPGSPEIAETVKNLIQAPVIHLDSHSWGLDHGTWSVLRHLYPKADIPVLQLSIDMSEPGSYHFDLGKKLSALRDAGVMILGSGNIVHNLQKIDWKNPDGGYSWAQDFDLWVKEKIDTRDYSPLFNQFNETLAGRNSVPTPDHYLPLLYALGASDEKDTLKYEFEGLQMGALSMRSLSLF